MTPDTDSYRRMAMLRKLPKVDPDHAEPGPREVERRRRNRMRRLASKHVIITACLAALVLVVLAIVTGGVECAAQWWVG